MNAPYRPPTHSSASYPPQWIFHQGHPHESEYQGYLCTYLMGIEFVGIGHTPVKQVEIHNLCTYPLGIEYTDIKSMQGRICAHILRKLNMQAQQKR